MVLQIKPVVYRHQPNKTENISRDSNGGSWPNSESEIRPNFHMVRVHRQMVAYMPWLFHRSTRDRARPANRPAQILSPQRAVLAHLSTGSRKAHASQMSVDAFR